MASKRGQRVEEASSAKVNSVPCDQARFVGRKVRDDARDIVWAGDVDQIATFLHVPSNLVGHPSWLCCSSEGTVATRTITLRTMRVRPVRDYPGRSCLLLQTFVWSRPQIAQSWSQIRAESIRQHGTVSAFSAIRRQAILDHAWRAPRLAPAHE